MLPSRPAPTFWIFGGPNGSGKSTAYSRSEVEGFDADIWIVNPDLLTARLQIAEKLNAANLAAVQRLEIWLEATLRVHQSVGVETVLSTDKYRRMVLLAKSLGYTFHLFYVMLESPELNIERVSARVLDGGHDVPRDKIVERYRRSLGQMPWFLEMADLAEVFDNSGASPRLISRKRDDELIVVPDAPRNFLDAIKQL